MKLASFVEGSRRRIGVVNLDTSTIRALDASMQDMIDLIERYSRTDELRSIEGPEIPLDRVKLLAPIAPRRNIFCVGKNYREHAKEFAGSGYEAGAVKGKEIDEYPAVFSKPPTTVVANGDTVSLHPHATSAVDYEAELAVVIGKGGRDIKSSTPTVTSSATRSSTTSPPATGSAITSSGYLEKVSTPFARWVLGSRRPTSWMRQTSLSNAG